MQTMNSLDIKCRYLWDGVSMRENRVVRVENGRVAAVSEDIAGAEDAYLLSPGLIDNHIHGCGGYSAMNPSPDALALWLKELAARGVCGAVLTAYGSIDQIRAALKAADAVMNGPRAGARLYGVHLEGPFISDKRPGAMPEGSIIAPSIKAYNDLTRGYERAVREITLAPEVEGAGELIAYLRTRGVKMLAGHTDCDYTEARRAFDSGVGAVCHLFNACRPIHHREPGVIASALNDRDVFCEIIGDLEHVHIEIIRLALACKGADRLMLISDGVFATGLKDGVYEECGRQIRVEGGAPRELATGALFGGGAYIPESVKRLVDAGIALEQALKMASTTPAKWLGLPENIIRAGGEAFMTAFNKDLSPEFTLIGDRYTRCGGVSNDDL